MGAYLYGIIDVATGINYFASSEEVASINAMRMYKILNEGISLLSKLRLIRCHHNLRAPRGGWMGDSEFPRASETIHSESECNPSGLPIALVASNIVVTKSASRA